MPDRRSSLCAGALLISALSRVSSFALSRSDGFGWIDSVTQIPLPTAAATWKERHHGVVIDPDCLCEWHLGLEAIPVVVIDAPRDPFM